MRNDNPRRRVRLFRFRNEAGGGSGEKRRGELTAAMYAVKTAAARGIKDITIYHDYSGIAKWYKKEWKAQSFCAARYLEFMEKYRPYMEISFVKVEGHSGVPLNEYADMLAKSALEKE